MNKEYPKQLAEEVLYDSFCSEGDLNNMFVIIYDGLLYVSSTARTFHKTREQAVKHFYNDFKWRATSKLRRHLAGDYWWNTNIEMPNSNEIWKMFKKVINDENKFKIIPWLYAKEELF